MPGKYFAKESQVTLALCGCVLARDEADHSTEDTHWLSSVHVSVCSEHAAAGTHPVEVMKHAMSAHVLENAVRDNLPPESWIPVFRDGAVPEAVKDKSGAIVGWQYLPADVAGRNLIQDLEIVPNVHDGTICVRHPDASKAVLDAASAALAAFRHCNLTVADRATHAKVFAAVDAHAAAGGGKERLFFMVGAGGISTRQALRMK